MPTKEENPRMEILVAILFLLTQRTFAVNFTNILQQYALTCGHSHLCNWSAIQNVVFPAKTYDGPDICPNCACDRQCIDRGDCCPDVLFPHPGLACLNLAIVDPNNKKKHALALIECPANTPAVLAEKCSGKYSSMEKLTLTPVSSASNLAVYRNKFCAECFKEVNTVPWSLNIDCPGMIDLNHLTSYDAIIDMIEENSCSMTYRSPNNQNYVSCDRPKLRKFENIDGCNTTGRWVKYDPDIEWACRTLDHRYKYYKNIFCYMCNPGQHRRSDHVVGICNQTGEWAVFDKSLQHACETSPAAPEAYPFKNVFCFQCNRNANDDEIFIDATIDIESDERVWMESLLKFRIKSFDNLQVYIEDPMDRASTINTTYNSSLYGMTVENREKEVDIQKLLFMHFLHYGHQRYCDKTLSFQDAQDSVGNNLPVCGCDVTCVLTSDCCTDFAMTSPVQISTQIPGFVVSKCYNTTDISYLQISCENTTTDASFANIPITSSQSKVVYRNVYCFLCNEGRDLLPPKHSIGNFHISLLEDKFNPLYLKMKCNFLIKYEEFYLLGEFMKSIENIGRGIRHEKCVISFPSHGHNDRFQENTYSTCNATGQWDVHDPDVQWACENYIPDITDHVSQEISDYSNIFCRICNTNSNSETPIDTCNETGHIEPTNVTMATRCDVYPRAPSMLTYKNKFCAECYPVDTKLSNKKFYQSNNYFIDPDKCNDKLIEVMQVLQSTYRKMFTFRALSDNSVLSEAKDANTTGRCPTDQVFDSKKVVCRPLHCSQGKYLTGNACRPFLPHTTLLGYTMAVRVVVTFTQVNNDTVGQVIESLRNVIRDHIPTTLYTGTEDIEFVSMYLLVPKGCDSGIDPTGQQFLLHTSFFIAAMIDRLATEDNLVNMTSSDFSVIVQDKTCHVKFEYDQEALELPTTIHTADLEGSCFLVSHDDFSYASDKYKLSYVSKFLACQHVEIDEDQYESEDDGFHVNLLPNGPRLHFGEFRKTSTSKRVQICLDDFEQMMTSQIVADENSTKETAMFILQVMSFVCVCLSILGLFATFLTYCFFSSLRTLPGKNNMCLILSLFFSQFLTQLGISQPKDKMLCAIFGLMIHYFWLATFLSMNVCSYHMFQVFVFPLRQVKSKRKECLTHVRYLFYCLGVPALIIAVYVTISVIVYDSVGYGNDEKCFISSLPAFMATFIGPVSLICLVNAAFFCVTVYTISTVPHVSSNKSSRREVTIHIKLFLLTGISWIFQLIDSFVPISIFSVIVNFVNASQGIFLFIAYSLNRRVRKFYKHGLSSRFSSISSLTKSSNSSSVEEQQV